MNEGDVDYQKIIHKLLNNEIKTFKEVKKVEKKYKEKKDGDNEIRTCRNAGERKQDSSRG